MDGASHHGACGDGYGHSDSPGLAGAQYHRGTRLALDQEACGACPRMAREARTERRMSEADRAGLVGLQRDPAPGPSLPPPPCPAAPRAQRPHRTPNRGGGVGLVCTHSPGPMVERCARGAAHLWSPASPPASVSCAGSRRLVVYSACSPKKRQGRSDPLNLGFTTATCGFQLKEQGRHLRRGGAS